MSLSSALAKTLSPWTVKKPNRGAVIIVLIGGVLVGFLAAILVLRTGPWRAPVPTSELTPTRRLSKLIPDPTTPSVPLRDEEGTGDGRVPPAVPAPDPIPKGISTDNGNNYDIIVDIPPPLCPTSDKDPVVDRQDNDDGQSTIDPDRTSCSSLHEDAVAEEGVTDPTTPSVQIAHHDSAESLVALADDTTGDRSATDEEAASPDLEPVPYPGSVWDPLREQGLASRIRALDADLDRGQYDPVRFIQLLDAITAFAIDWGPVAATYPGLGPTFARVTLRTAAAAGRYYRAARLATWHLHVLQDTYRARPDVTTLRRMRHVIRSWAGYRELVAGAASSGPYWLGADVDLDPDVPWESAPVDANRLWALGIQAGVVIGTAPVGGGGCRLRLVRLPGRTLFLDPIWALGLRPARL